MAFTSRIPLVCIRIKKKIKKKKLCKKREKFDRFSATKVNSLYKRTYTHII